MDSPSDDDRDFASQEMSRNQFSMMYEVNSEKSDMTSSLDGDNDGSIEDIFIPSGSDDNCSDLSDELEHMICMEELKDSEKFFLDILDRDYDDKTSADLKLALEKNRELIVMTEDFVEKLNRLKSKIVDELESLLGRKLDWYEIDRHSDLLDDDDDFLSEIVPVDMLEMQDRPFSDIVKSIDAKEERVPPCHYLGQFYSQFNTCYFKDADGFPCPPNKDALRIKAQEKVSVTSLIHRCKEWSLRELKAVESILKKCLIDDFKNRKSDLLAIEQYESYVRLHSLDEILKEREFKFDWMKISTLLLNNFKFDRSYIDLERLWNVFLDPKFKKDSWTAEEDERLVKLAEIYGGHNWDVITDELGTRRGVFHVYVRYAKELYTKATAGKKWTPEEDEHLKFLVQKFTQSGRISWSRVMYFMEERSYDQIYNRYHNTLRASKMGKFSAIEDQMILNAFFKHNLGSDTLVKVFNYQRSHKQIRGRIEALNAIRKGNIFGEFSLAEDEKLLRLVECHGCKWSKIAKEFGSRDRTQLRHRYSKLKKKLLHPNFKLENLDRSKGDLRAYLKVRNKKIMNYLRKSDLTKADTEALRRLMSLGRRKRRMAKDDCFETVEEKEAQYMSVLNNDCLPKVDPVIRYLIEVGSSKWCERKRNCDNIAELTVAACKALHADLIDDPTSVDDEHLLSVRELLDPINDEWQRAKERLFKLREVSGGSGIGSSAEDMNFRVVHSADEKASTSIIDVSYGHSTDSAKFSVKPSMDAVDLIHNHLPDTSVTTSVVNPSSSQTSDDTFVGSSQISCSSSSIPLNSQDSDFQIDQTRSKSRSLILPDNLKLPSCSLDMLKYGIDAYNPPSPLNTFPPLSLVSQHSTNEYSSFDSVSSNDMSSQETESSNDHLKMEVSYVDELFINGKEEFECAESSENRANAFRSESNYDINAPGTSRQSDFAPVVERIQNINVLPPCHSTCMAFTNSLLYLTKSQRIKHRVLDPPSESLEVAQAKLLWQKRLFQLFLWPAVLSDKQKKNKISTYSRAYEK